MYLYYHKKYSICIGILTNCNLKCSTSFKDGRSFGTELSMRFSSVFPEADDEIAVERVFELVLLRLHSGTRLNFKAKVLQQSSERRQVKTSMRFKTQTSSSPSMMSSLSRRLYFYDDDTLSPLIMYAGFLLLLSLAYFQI